MIVGDQIAVLFGYQPKTNVGIIEDDYLPWEPFPANFQPGDENKLQKASYATFAYDRVFDPALFKEFTINLYELVRKGGTVIWKMENVQVFDQPHLGVESYRLDKLLWIVNSEVKDFYNKLEEEIQLAIDAEDLGAFPHFPYYDTIEQLELTKQQVNLLAHLSCWNVISENISGNQHKMTNRDLVLSMFD